MNTWRNDYSIEILSKLAELKLVSIFQRLMPHWIQCNLEQSSLSHLEPGR